MHRLIALIAFLALTGMNLAVAQAPKVEDIQKRLKALESTTLEDDVKARVKASLEAALADLNLLDASSEETKKHDAAVRKADGEKQGFERQLNALNSANGATAAETEVERLQRQAAGRRGDQGVASLKQKAAESKAALDRAEQEVAKLEATATKRQERRTALPAKIADVDAEITALRAQVTALVREGKTQEEAESEEIALRAKVAAREAFVLELKAEQKMYPDTEDRFASEKRLAVAKATEARAINAVWQREVESARRKTNQFEAERTRNLLARAEGEKLDEKLIGIIKKCMERADRLIELGALIKEATNDLASTKKKFDAIKKSREEIDTRIGIAGLNDEIGALLRDEKKALNPDEYRRKQKPRDDEMKKSRIERLDLVDEIASLSPANAAVDTWLLKKAVDFELTVSALSDYLLNLSGRVSDDSENLYQLLVELDSNDRLLIKESEEFLQFIDTRILWIPSTVPVWKFEQENRDAFTEAWAWLTDGSHWAGAAASIRGQLDGNLVLSLLIALLALACWLLRPRIMRAIRADAEAARSRRCVTFRPTLRTFGLTILLATPASVLLWTVGRRILSEYYNPVFSSAFGNGLKTAGLVWLGLEVLRKIVRQDGLADAHFDWSNGVIALLRRHLRWLTILVVPASLLLTMLNDQGAWNDNLGRLVLIVALFALAIFFWRLLSPSTGVFSDHYHGARTGIVYRLRHFWLILGIGVPSTLALLAAVGYMFTADELSGTLLNTLALLLVVVVGHSLTMRWLKVTRRQLRLEQATAKRQIAAQAVAQEDDASGTSESELARAEAELDDLIDVAEIDHQTQRLVRTILGATVVLGAYLIWVDVLPALGALKRIDIWTASETISRVVPDKNGQETLEEVVRIRDITMADLLLAAIILFLATVIARNLINLIEATVLKKMPIQQGSRYAIVSLVRYIVTIVGFVIAFGQIGIGWENVQWMAAAMTVGLAFGLQEIFANFVSGVIILAERPVRIGDLVTVAGTTGCVSKIRMRATTILDFDKRELIVPNKSFITQEIINWTLSDTLSRIVIPVGVAYGSDTKKARDTLMDLATSHALVLENPGPSVLFNGFADSSLAFALRVYIETRDHWLQVVNDLHFAIDDAFRREGIEIAFPQQDIHIRTMGPLGESIADRTVSSQELGETA